MTNVVALRHIAFEDVGTIASLLTRRGLAIEYVDAGVDDLLAIEAAAPDLLIVLGGPIGVYETDRYPFLLDEISLIEQRLASGRPMLGICLGAQLIARAAGCRVFPGPEKEIGYGPVELTVDGLVSPLSALEMSQFNVLHWHGDTFDLPAGAVRLASTGIAQNQAFSLGPEVLALQFHIETEPAKFERWLIANTLEIAAAGLEAGELRRQNALHGPSVAVAGQAVFKAWLDEVLPHPVG
jgi:GMP synthase (glutamine-hydrolysing)